jgi:hypothetical protein
VTDPIINIKRGDTLTLQCELRTDGTPLPIGGWQIDCWLRDRAGRKIAALTVTPADITQGRYQLDATSAETAAWPTGSLDGDIRYRDATGRVMHTHTFRVHVGRSITTPTTP